MLICNHISGTFVRNIGLLMKELNPNASLLTAKYIRQSSTVGNTHLVKKRGLQAEVNKLQSIRKVLVENAVDDRELLRFRTELEKMLSLVEVITKDNLTAHG